MKMPVRFVIGNLIWSRDGAVWSIYRVKPTSYPYLSDREKMHEHSKMRQAFMSIPKESMILSICEILDPEEVVHDMELGVEESNEAWHEAVNATFEALHDVPLFQRKHYLAIKLPSEDVASSAATIFGSAQAMFRSKLGLAAAPVSSKEIDERLRQSRNIEAKLRNSLVLKPLSAGEVNWLYARATVRGIDQPYLDEGWEPTVRQYGEGEEAKFFSPSLTSFGEAVFKEGGFKDDKNRPKHNRYLRIDTDSGTSFQTFLAVSDMPHKFVFPNGSGEWFYHADAVPFPVDWCARITSVPNQEAQHKTKRQARQLVGQVSEYDSEPTGAPQTLAEAMEGIDDQRAYLGANPSEPELQATIIYSLAANNLQDLEEQAAQLQSLYEPNEYALPRPTGGQLKLYEAMLPGSATPYVANDYTQFLLTRDMAAGMPFAGSSVGDPRGMMLGAMLDGGTFQPVLFDPAYGPAINRSGSLGAFGVLGSGKSYFIKNVTWATLARGGQVLALDRTVTGEYVDFAGVSPGTSQVVRLTTGSDISLDPLRTFKDADRVRFSIGFLTMLTGTSPTDIQGAILSEAVRDVATREDASLPMVITWLEERADDDEDAKVLWRKLRNFANNDLAALAFGDGEVLHLDADYIVFHAPGLSLPDRDSLLNEHLAKQLLPEQIFSQALLYLVAAVARKVTFSNPDRFAAALFDEAWALTSSIQGRQLILDGIRDGRKHNAAIWLLSQHPNDLGDNELAHLLGNRFVFKQTRGAATAALKFLGMDTAEQWVELLETGMGSGQCLYRDVRDRIGLIQVLEAPTEALREAFDTNPEVRRERRQAEENKKQKQLDEIDRQSDASRIYSDTDYVKDDSVDEFDEPAGTPEDVDGGDDDVADVTQLRRGRHMKAS